MNIDRIQFFTVPVSDLTEARDFYLGKLGAELRAQGVEVDDAEEMPWGRVTSLKDPDGNAMGLLEASGYGNWPR
ncbi:hypothetical protein AB0E55_15290 [Amycolatopsis keratiniphila]|uniref:hypothetical protein n=1 Tax=Amycolatopsis keratiniphila TaxID=129921 RepID=UPI0033F31B89